MISYDIYCDTPMAAYWALLEIGIDKTILDAMSDEELMVKLDDVKEQMGGDY